MKQTMKVKQTELAFDPIISSTIYNLENTQRKTHFIGRNSTFKQGLNFDLLLIWWVGLNGNIREALLHIFFKNNSIKWLPPSAPLL